MFNFRSFFAALFLMMLAGCCNVPHNAYKAETLQHYKDATVAFVLQTADGDIHTYCSGFFVDDLLITAHHCPAAALQYEIRANVPAELQPLMEELMKNLDLAGNTMIYETESEMPQIGFQPEQGHIATIIYDDPKHDLTVLETKKAPFHRNLEISDRDPVPGEEIIQVGHPAGLTWSISYGRVSSIRSGIEGFDREGPFVQAAIGTIGGNSGDALISAETGGVIGVMSFGVGQYETYGFAIHRQSIMNCLREARNAQKQNALKKLKN